MGWLKVPVLVDTDTDGDVPLSMKNTRFCHQRNDWKLNVIIISSNTTKTALSVPMFN